MKSVTKIAAVIVIAGFICGAIALQFTVPGMAATYKNDTKTEEAVSEQTEDELQSSESSLRRHINYKTISGSDISVDIVSSEDDSTIFMYTSLYGGDVRHACVKRGTDGSYEITDSTLDGRDVENILSMIA